MDFDRSWMGQQRPFVISGPCSAESEKQLLQIGHALVALNKVQVFRAGIWKPRTRPDSFHGVGDIGLRWLERVKAETGLPIAVEVANAHHVELCLKHNIDLLWIGARTTVNPFSVQEIANALKGVDKPVLVKNPINPDPDLWLGAIERIYQTGNKKVAAVHRGFSRYRKTMYRNDPEWQIPIEIMRRIPGIPMLCDPSHISGNRELISSVSQKAMDLGYDGLMIESHHEPEKAWSDAKQQITPDMLGVLLGGIALRKVEKITVSNDLEALRERIDQVDREIVDLLANRMGLSEAIGTYKKANGIAILQADRWNEIVANVLKYGEMQHLGEDFLRKFLDALHEESINHQAQVMNPGSAQEKIQ